MGYGFFRRRRSFFFCIGGFSRRFLRRRLKPADTFEPAAGHPPDFVEAVGKVLVAKGVVQPQLIRQPKIMPDDFQLYIGLGEQRLFLGSGGVIRLNVQLQQI